MNSARRVARMAAALVWLIVSGIVAGILAAPFLLGSAGVREIAPVCERKARSGRECALCGMTTAFLSISEGRLDRASRSNRASLPLYGLFATNELLFLCCWRRAWRAARRPAFEED